MQNYAMVQGDLLTNVIVVEPDDVAVLADALGVELLPVSELPDGAWTGWTREVGQWRPPAVPQSEAPTL